MCILSKLHACRECICSVHAFVCMSFAYLFFVGCFAFAYYKDFSVFLHVFVLAVMRFKLRRWIDDTLALGAQCKTVHILTDKQTKKLQYALELIMIRTCTTS